MARLDPPQMEELTEQQKQIYAAITRSRPRVSGPFGVWLRIPPIAEAARQTGQFNSRHRQDRKAPLRVHRDDRSGALDRVLRLGGARTDGKGHRRHADVIEAIRTGKKPNFTKQDEAIIYDAVTSLLRKWRTRRQDAYQALLKTFGLNMTIEIVSVAGIYSMIATVINGLELPTPNGEKPFA